MESSNGLIMGWIRKALKEIFVVLKETYSGWLEARGTLLAAGLSYYAIFSLTPMLVIAITIADLVFDENLAVQRLIQFIESMAGRELAITIQILLLRANTHPSTASFTTLISLLATLIGASILFVQLKLAINLLWGIVPQRGKGLIVTLRTHFLSFAFVLGIGLLLLMSMLASTFLIAVDQYIHVLPLFLQNQFPQFNFGLAFTLSAFLFAVIFKYLPDAKIAWRDVLIGSAVTSLLFTLGELLIGRYLGKVDFSQGFGAASSILLILIWVYLSMQIILLGAKFTQVYADHHGSKVLPSIRADLLIRQRINHQTIHKLSQGNQQQ